jgi:hypothetical protein
MDADKGNARLSTFVSRHSPALAFAGPLVASVGIRILLHEPVGDLFIVLLSDSVGLWLLMWVAEGASGIYLVGVGDAGLGRVAVRDGDLLRMGDASSDLAGAASRIRSPWCAAQDKWRAAIARW